jgi:hypothetical protein
MVDGLKALIKGKQHANYVHTLSRHMETSFPRKEFSNRHEEYFEKFHW